MSNARGPVIGVAGYSITRPGGSREVGVKEQYVRAVRLAVGTPVVLVPEADPRRLAALLDAVDGVLLTGGNDVDPAYFDQLVLNDTVKIDADRDSFELPLARLVYERDVPLLAICRGCQVLNVALGGSLWQDLPAQLPGSIAHRQQAPMAAVTHAIQVDASSVLARSLGLSGASQLTTNTSHHQAVNRVAPALVATARSEDGVIEAVEAPNRRFTLGVQWHPEWLAAAWAEHRALFKALVQAARCA